MSRSVVCWEVLKHSARFKFKHNGLLSSQTKFFGFEAEIAIKTPQWLARLKGLNFLGVQENLGGNVVNELYQQFYFEIPHHSEHAVRANAKLVLGNYLVIRVVFGDACPALVLFGDYIVKDWWTISAHALLVSLSLHLYTLHVDYILTTVDYLAVLDNAGWYRDFASLN